LKRIHLGINAGLIHKILWLGVARKTTQDLLARKQRVNRRGVTCHYKIVVYRH